MERRFDQTRDQHKGTVETTQQVDDVPMTDVDLQEAKRVIVKMDASLPKPKHIKIRDVVGSLNVRIRVQGWIHKLRRQGKNLMFVVLRDGSGFLPCVIHDVLCHTYEALTLATEATVTMYGIVRELPQGKTASGGHELDVDFWELVGSSPTGGADSLLNQDPHVDVQLDNRHMRLRAEEASGIMKLRSAMLRCFRDHYDSRGYFEVNPPMLVETKGEEGVYLFKLPYFGKEAYLADSSQFYLESCLPFLGDVFSITQSHRAENTTTRRHLAEFTHIEAECSFIDFDGLLDNLEELVCDVVDRVLKSPYSHIIYELNPDFKPPKKPFKRMQYTEALSYLKQHDITKAGGSHYVFGDVRGYITLTGEKHRLSSTGKVITEDPERRMMDMINEPMFLCRFPANIVSLYMLPNEEDNRLTDSVDLLMPNVGETIGGSIRIADLDELYAGFKRKRLDPTPYYWYTDQRKYGTCPHGGYGLGLERFLCWLLNRHHIREVCLYPRFVGRCRP